MQDHHGDEGFARLDPPIQVFRGADPFRLTLFSNSDSSFGDKVSLCSPGLSGTHHVGQAGLKNHRDPFASASRVLKLKACFKSTIPGKIILSL